jgi:dolichol-phosphate mannosyltransferase
MKLSVVIPARDEEGCIEQTLVDVAAMLLREQIPYEIVVVDDGSTDQTPALVRSVTERYPGVRLVSNTGTHGFGLLPARPLP